MAQFNQNTQFSDLAAREKLQASLHENEKKRYEEIKRKRALSEWEQADLDRHAQILKALGATVKNNSDPIVVSATKLLNERGMVDPEFEYVSDTGVLNFVAGTSTTAGKAKEPPFALVALTFGILLIDEATAPQLKSNGNKIEPDRRPDSKWSEFTRQFFAAIGEVQSYGKLAEDVLVLLAKEGDPDGPRGAAPAVDSREFARVMRGLADRRVQSDEPQLRRRVNEVLDNIQHIGSEDNVGDLNIDLPDLEAISNQNIISDNVRIMGPMIVSAMFDELKVFQVVDRVVDQFQNGMLPIGPGDAGKLLYKYWRDAPNRISEQERRNFAAMTLGIPGGDSGGMVNREFNDLWIRFVSSVSSFIRQSEVDSLLRASTPSAISHQQVRKSARDLASNLSLHGYGMAHYAARELQSQIKFMIDLLQDKEILAAFGSKDMWQVVDQVATYDLGGAKTSSRYRTLATCGTIITAWLATNVERVNRPTGMLIDLEVVRNPHLAPVTKATVKPNDYDLVNACELWLADTSTTDTQIEELAQPREAAAMTSKPIPIPTLARDMLSEMGDLGVGMGQGGRRGNGFAGAVH